MNSKRAFGILRIAFGTIWAVDAFLKWNAVFQNGITGYLTNALAGQPPPVQAWLNLWIGIVGQHPHFYAILVAVLETALAVSLLSGLGTRIALIGGSIFSFLLWSLPEGFGGPYAPGMADVSASIIYIFVFAALWIGMSWQIYSLDEMIRRKYPKAPFSKNDGASYETKTSGNKWVMAWMLFLVVVLVSIVASEYIPATTSPQVGVGAMAPMGMIVKTFDVNPSSTIPTINFTITQDPTSMGGWDIHITTTNFTFTPQNVNQPPVPNQGHVHLYVDGTLYVVYSPWYHLDDLTSGQHTITVALAANDHSVFALNGNYIQAQKNITQN